MEEVSLKKGTEDTNKNKLLCSILLIPNPWSLIPSEGIIAISDVPSAINVYSMERHGVSIFSIGYNWRRFP